MIQEVITMKKVWTIRKYENNEKRLKGIPFDIVKFEGNLLLNEGITALQNLLIGGAEDAYNNTNTRLGVGDASSGEAAAQTGLMGANKTHKAMAATYPLIASQTTTFRSVFNSGEANHAWNEFTVVNAADDTGDNLNRKVSAQGTKVSGQEWTLDLAITWS